MASDQRLETRLTNLEHLFTHLERQVAELNAVVLRGQQQLDLLERQIRLLQQPSEDDDDAPPEPVG